MLSRATRFAGAAKETLASYCPFRNDWFCGDKWFRTGGHLVLGLGLLILTQPNRGASFELGVNDGPHIEAEWKEIMSASRLVALVVAW